MASFKTLALAAAAMAVLAAQPTRAADMPRPYFPPVVEEYGGWYLRGDIGMTKQKFDGLSHPLFATPLTFQWLDRGQFESGMLFGLGLGYQYNNWLRFDGTLEYRGRTGFSALDRYTDAGDCAAPDPCTNDYRATKSEWLLMFNTYVDLGTWKSITPFVGAGLGAAQVTIENFRDTNVIAGGGGYATRGSQWNFAWALHAGLAYNVTPNFTVELAYRYLHLGDGRTSTLHNLAGPCVTTCAPMKFKGLYSHDLKLGVRWMMSDMGLSDWQPPVSAKY